MMKPKRPSALTLSAGLFALALAAAPLAADAGAPDAKAQRLEITTQEGVSAPDAKAILHVLLGDQEGSGQRQVRRVTPTVLRRYHEAYQRHFDLWKTASRRHGIPMARVAAEGDLLTAIQAEAALVGVIEAG